MKAELREVKAWSPYEDKDRTTEFNDGKRLRIYVGKEHVGWAEVVTTEPEELFSFDAVGTFERFDFNENLFKTRGMPLQEILDDIELVFKEFLKRIAK